LEDEEAVVHIGYSKLKDVGIMELGDQILTFIYHTVRIELAIKRNETEFL